MAPSATETTTQAQPQHSYQLHLSQYKNISSSRVSRDVEEGKTGEVPASVCPPRILSTLPV